MSDLNIAKYVLSNQFPSTASYFSSFKTNPVVMYVCAIFKTEKRWAEKTFAEFQSEVTHRVIGSFKLSSQLFG